MILNLKDHKDIVLEYIRLKEEVNFRKKRIEEIEAIIKPIVLPGIEGSEKINAVFDGVALNWSSEHNGRPALTKNDAGLYLIKAELGDEAMNRYVYFPRQRKITVPKESKIKAGVLNVG